MRSYRFTDWTRYRNVTPDHWDATVTIHTQRKGRLASVTLTLLPDRQQHVTVLRWTPDARRHSVRRRHLGAAR